MEGYAEKNDCKYLNLFEYVDEIGLDCEKDFSDTDHLNAKGAKKVTNFLGKYIVQNYNVTDMRNINNNIWQNNL